MHISHLFRYFRRYHSFAARNNKWVSEMYWWALHIWKCSCIWFTVQYTAPIKDQNLDQNPLISSTCRIHSVIWDLITQLQPAIMNGIPTCSNELSICEVAARFDRPISAQLRSKIEIPIKLRLNQAHVVLISCFKTLTLICGARWWMGFWSVLMSLLHLKLQLDPICRSVHSWHRSKSQLNKAISK